MKRKDSSKTFLPQLRKQKPLTNEVEARLLKIKRLLDYVQERNEKKNIIQDLYVLGWECPPRFSTWLKIMNIP